ncbi:MAG: cysteine--tRNA ligase, partial [Rickettsiales bacterium]|nr:cysteine--tRNA ligase [Rickettsiales bacterium]
MKLHLHNSLSDRKEEFIPHNPSKIGMYVCGPTVYDFPHIGNARAVVVYDILYRILLLKYDAENFSEVISGKKTSQKVTYVRNITDVDDKINKAAIENKESIQNLTARITKFFQEDMAELNNLEPSFQPKVTENIPEIIATIERILQNKNAYISEGHILLDVKSIKPDETYHYGVLSGKQIEQNIAGARVQVESYKKNPEDFVLWKPADAEDDISSVFESPWGKGRPGWHIECTAMSNKILGSDFDIHGGGADLKFPHHENEIAQNKCANPHSHYAKYWVHNGFVTINGEKMSKSLGNFTSVRN